MQGTADSQYASKFRKRVFRSLLRNNTIEKLRIEVTGITDEEVTMFASVLVRNRPILELSVDLPDRLIGKFVEELSPGFVKNFTLISFPLSALYNRKILLWYPIIKIASRNQSPVTRAAHFVAGNRDRRRAEALEQVASSPALVDKLCQVPSMEKAEAAQKVPAVKDLQGITGFFLSSGIVKADLTCYEIQVLQLTDVDEYSWLAVRNFLRVGDLVRAEQAN